MNRTELFSMKNPAPPTAALENEIKTVSKVEDYLDNNKDYLISQSLSEHLNQLLSQKGVSRADVVRGSMLDRAYVYQIFSGEKTPSRDKLLAVAFGLKLSDSETQQLLKLSGNRALYAKDRRDAVILFALYHKKTLQETNDMLFDLGLAVLGVPMT
ncbi:MAG: helix-turn-helix transcriptional regulator [Lachnospiraceae bacterium]